MKFGFLALLPSSAARFLLAVGLVIALTARGVGADKQLRPSLENYLKRIGYEPVALNRNDDNKLMVRGQLGGKARIFMVDTGWSVTSVDTGAARKLKKLGAARRLETRAGDIPEPTGLRPGPPGRQTRRGKRNLGL